MSSRSSKWKPPTSKAQIDTNFYGVVNLTRAALPVMRGQRSGHVINISSVGGRVGTPGLSAYQAAKWAVGGFTEVMVQEIAPFGVKVIAVEPGGMRTDWGFTARGNAPAVLLDYEPSVGALLGMLKAYVGQEIGDPEKIAKVVVDLAGRDTLPAHLILGSDALHVFGQAEAAAAGGQGLGRRQRLDRFWEDRPVVPDPGETGMRSRTR